MRQRERQERQSMDMTTGKILPKFISFMFPVFFGNVVQQIYGLVDSMIVGRSMGSHALASIGATDSLTYLIIGCANGVAAGFAICTAQAKGSGDRNALRRYTVLITRFCLMISCVLGIFMMCITPQLLKWMHTPEGIRSMSVLYLVIIFAGLPVTMCLNGLLAVLRSVGDSRIGFYLLILSAGTNTGLDLWLIVVLKFGVGGAAFATVIAQALVLLAGVIYTRHRHPEICFYDAGADRCQESERTGRISYVSCKEIRELLKNGIPMGIQVAITAVATMIIQIALNRCGTDYIAAFTIGTKIQNMLTQLFHALGMTVATYIGQNTGKGDIIRIRQGIRTALGVGVFCALLCMGVIILLLDVGISLFGTDVTEEIRRYCHYFMNCCMIGYIPLSFLFVFRNALQAMGEGRAALGGGICELLARTLVVVFLAPSFGYYGICLGHTAAWTMALLPLVPLYLHKLSGWDSHSYYSACRQRRIPLIRKENLKK